MHFAQRRHDLSCDATLELSDCCHIVKLNGTVVLGLH